MWSCRKRLPSLYASSSIRGIRRRFARSRCALRAAWSADDLLDTAHQAVNFPLLADALDAKEHERNGDNSDEDEYQKDGLNGLHRFHECALFLSAGPEVRPTTTARG